MKGTQFPPPFFSPVLFHEDGGQSTTEELRLISEGVVVVFAHDLIPEVTRNVCFKIKCMVFDDFCVFVWNE